LKGKKISEICNTIVKVSSLLVNKIEDITANIDVPSRGGQKGQ